MWELEGFRWEQLKRIEAIEGKKDLTLPRKRADQSIACLRLYSQSPISRTRESLSFQINKLSTTTEKLEDSIWNTTQNLDAPGKSKCWNWSKISITVQSHLLPLPSKGPQTCTVVAICNNYLTFATKDQRVYNVLSCSDVTLKLSFLF